MLYAVKGRASYTDSVRLEVTTRNVVFLIAYLCINYEIMKLLSMLPLFLQGSRESRPGNPRTDHGRSPDTKILGSSCKVIEDVAKIKFDNTHHTANQLRRHAMDLRVFFEEKLLKNK